jgi:hypothetical protein
MTSRLVGALCALLLPTTALAQPVPVPHDPEAPESTEPARPPVVIVNPPPSAPRRRLVLEPQYETIYDDYNAAVFTTGALVFAASYGASAFAAATASEDNYERGFDRLYLPIVGPWLTLSEYGDCPITNVECDEEITTKVLLVADGVFQAAGVLVMLDGILEPSSRRVPVRNSKLDTKLRVTPVSVKGNPGLAVVGRF